MRKQLILLARPEGLEPPTYWFEASRSILTELRARDGNVLKLKNLKGRRESFSDPACRFAEFLPNLCVPLGWRSPVRKHIVPIISCSAAMEQAEAASPTQPHD